MTSLYQYGKKKSTNDLSAFHRPFDGQDRLCRAMRKQVSGIGAAHSQLIVRKKAADLPISLGYFTFTRESGRYPYIRIKWIKGHPYLYEQESYRVGNKVKTRYIRYVGKASPETTGGIETAAQRPEIPDEWYDLTLYRGSSAQYDTFDMTQAGTGDGSGVFGKGVYLTDNKDVADFYALQSGKRQHIESYTEGVFGTPEPVYKPNAEALAQQTKVINVFKVKAKLLDADTYPIDSESKKMLIDLLAENIGNRTLAEETVERAIDFSKNNADKIYNYQGELQYVLDQTVGNDPKAMDTLQAYFKQQGYDGIKFQGDQKFEGAKGNNYLIFDTSKVKSVQPPHRKARR